MASYSSAGNVNLTEASITDITISKMGGKDKISIMAQFLELDLYMSIFRSVMTAELVVNDTISLVSNYPLVGEETIEITYRPTEDDANDSRTMDSFREQLNNLDNANVGSETIPKLKFVVTEVNRVYPDDTTRSSIYSIKLHSPEYLENLKQNIMRAYKVGYHESIQSILKDYLKADPQKVRSTNFEESRGVVTTVVPNMRPFPTIMWFMQRAVPKESNHFNYMFYEDLQGFKFKTLQKLFEDGKSKAKEQRKAFIYFSDAVNKDQSLSQNEQISVKQSTVSAIAFNKRHSTQQKVTAGFYENEFVEIDLLNLTVTSKVTKAKETPENTIGKSQLNTPEFLKSAQTNSGNVGDHTRVRYVISHGGGDQPNAEHHWKEKFGEAARSYSALSEVQISVAVPGDTRVNPGDIIKLDVPEFHGFNEVKDDPYISGLYIVTDMKHTISVGMKHTMVLNLARDSYEQNIAPQHNYNLNP